MNNPAHVLNRTTVHANLFETRQPRQYGALVIRPSMSRLLTELETVSFAIFATRQANRNSRLRLPDLDQ